jgi:Na+/H+-dicarboxylate symporter
VPEAHTPSTPRRGLTLTHQLFIALILGVAAGALVDHYNPSYAIYFRPFGQLFLRLIKMVIAPLIFATLVAGIAGAGHVKAVGRMGLRAIVYFEVVTTLALLIGLVAVNVMRPGVGVNLPIGQQSEIRKSPEARRHGTRSSCTSFPNPSSTQWHAATCSRSWSSASSSASRSA